METNNSVTFRWWMAEVGQKVRKHNINISKRAKVLDTHKERKIIPSYNNRDWTIETQNIDTESAEIANRNDLSQDTLE